MSTDKSLFPDVTERYEREPPVVADPEPQKFPVPPPVAQSTEEQAAELLPDEFDHAPAWLVTPEPAQPPDALDGSRSRRPVLVGAVAMVLVLAGAATAVVLRGSTSTTTGAPRAVAAASQSPSPTPAAVPSTQPPVAGPVWCEEADADGRSVGSGPGSTSDGPGVIRAFDHAYYIERDGARVASLMVAPNPVPEIQRWIDDVPPGTVHCVTIAVTPDPTVFAVELGLRMPGAADGVIRQRVTVAPSPAGFKIAKVEDAQ